MVSKNFSSVWVPNSLRLVFHKKGYKGGVYHKICDWISTLGLGIYFGSRFL